MSYIYNVMSWIVLFSCTTSVQASMLDVSDPWMVQSTPSIVANGMGQTNSPLADDPFNSWVALGSGAASPCADSMLVISYTGFPGSNNTLPMSWSADWNQSTHALNVQVDLNAASRKLRGKDVSDSNLKLDISLFQVSNEARYTVSYNSEDGYRENYTCNSLRLGLGTWKENWSIGVGLGIDQLSKDIVYSWTPLKSSKPSQWLWDFGLNAQIEPLPRFNIDFYGSKFLSWRNAIQFSRLFIGGEMPYYGSYSVPTPRQDYLSMGSRITLGLPALQGHHELPLLELHGSLQHSVSLLEWFVAGHEVATTHEGDTLMWDETGNAVVWDGVGDIAYWGIYDTDYRDFDSSLLKIDDQTNYSWGIEVGLAETLYLRKGAMHGQDSDMYLDTKGWTLQSTGVFKYMLREQVFESVFLNRIFRKLDVKYSKSSVKSFDVVPHLFSSDVKAREIQISLLF